MAAAAFFDIDRTLVVGTALERCFLQQAWREGVLTPAALWRNVPAGLQALRLWPGPSSGRMRMPPGLSLLTRLRYAFLSGNKAYLRGLALASARRVAVHAFHSRVLGRLSDRARETLAWHRAAGRPIVLLTGTLDFLGEPLRAYLQADWLLAAEPEVHQGLLTGRLREPHPYGMFKRDLLQRFAGEHGLDLAASYGYADHHTDVPFLEALGHPVAVNPDGALRRLARQRGWRIEDW